MEQTSFIDKTSKKAFRRRWTNQMYEYAKMADNARLGTVERWQLEILAENLSIIGIQGGAVRLLKAIIKTAPPEQFLGGKQLPIVFKKNITFADELEREENTISHLLAHLVHNGLVVMRDSINCWRIAPKNGHSALV